MIKQIYIKKLFGRFDYNINTKDDGVTIITGPNGYGKSTILKIINALSQGDFLLFVKLDFSIIQVVFDNGEEVKIRRTEEKICFNNFDLNFEKIMKNNDVFDDFYKYNRYLTRISEDVYFDRRTGKRIPAEEALMYFLLSDEYQADYFFNSLGVEYAQFKELIINLKDWCGEVRFISEQRLIKKENKRRDEEQVIEVISELPEKLKEEINAVSSEYSKVANKLDGSYPKRLFSAKEGIKSEREFLNKLEEANSKFNKLNEYNLVDMVLIERTRFNEKFSEALKIYFDDFSEKYAVFEILIKKMDLFTKIINERLSFKKIVISRQRGFEIVDTEKKGHKLELSQLSSGEKQEIVLFYDLIFNTKSELLLLIDEPEISLHISWQKRFMDDLLKVAEDNNLQIIVATHSPQIISNHWDIQIDLGEEYGRQFNKK